MSDLSGAVPVVKESKGGGLRRRMPARPTWVAAGLALVCGAALNLAFQPVDWWWIAPFAVAGLSALTAGKTGKQGAFIGLAFGLGFCWVLFQWLRALGPGGQEALGTVEGLFWIPLGAGLARVSRLRFAPLWGACLWVGEEFLRSRYPFGGLPWGRLAFSQPHTPFTPFAALGGAPMVTFAVALSGGLLLGAVGAVTRDRRASSPGSGSSRASSPGAGVRWAAVSLALALAVPVAALAVPTPSNEDGTPVRLALIQGNVPRTGLDFDDQRAAVLTNHVQETENLARLVAAGEVPKPDAVIWPENASDIDPYTDPDASAAISRAVREMGVPVLVGAVVEAPDGTHNLNRMIVWDPRTGIGQTYDKTHLVPFGEYLPFRSFLTKLITRFNRIPQDFAPGHASGVLTVGPVTAAAAICFEVAYDGVVRDAVNGGGRVLLVPSNNASYARTGQTQQQVAIDQVRAVEHGRWTLQVATSGESAVISPDGAIVQHSAEFVQTYLQAVVRQSTYKTFADRVGDLPEWIAALAGLFVSLLTGGLGLGLRRGIRCGTGRARGTDTGSGAADANTESSNDSSTETSTETSSGRVTPLLAATEGRDR